MGDIGLGLVVVVVGHKILYRVVREKFLKLGAELGRQGLVVGQHQGGPLHRLDDLGHGEGLARTGDAKKGLLIQTVLNARRQGGDGLRGGLDACKGAGGLGGEHLKRQGQGVPL